MKNNNLKKVAIGVDGHKQARFNASRSINTSSDFGDLNVLMCQPMLAHSKFKFNVRKQVRAQTLLRPLAGGMKLDTYGYFVPKASVCPHYDAMLAGLPVSDATGLEKIPMTEPKIPANMLYLAGALIGAKSRLWVGCSDKVVGSTPLSYTTDDKFSEIKRWIHPKAGDFYSFDSHIYGAIGTLTNSPWTNGSGSVSAYSVDYFLYGDSCFAGSSKDHGRVRFADGSANGDFYGALVPCGSTVTDICEGDDSINPDNADFVFYFRTLQNAPDTSGALIGEDFGGCNGAIGSLPQNRWFAWCFKFSDIGKRWVKLLRGLGYGTDATDYSYVSLTRLLGAYQAYWEMFGIRLYENFEQTSLYKMIKSMEAAQDGFVIDMVHQGAPKYLAQTWNNPSSTWWDFVRDCCELWYTDAQDFVSMHTENVTPLGNTTGSQLEYATCIGFVDINRIVLGNADAMHDQIFHVGGGGNSAFGLAGDNGLNNTSCADVLDHRMLKILHKWTNRQSVLGMDIADTLRAQGYGKYVDESGIGPQFIGHHSLDLETQDVTSLADSYDIAANGEGARLGDQGGKSITTQKDGETWSWDTDVDGFLYVFSVVIPEGGYMQQVDATVRAIDRWSNYQPEFDGLGLELGSIDEVVSSPVGCTPWSGEGSSTTLAPNAISIGFSNKPFGYRPRESAWKIARNICNGDFILGSVRDDNSPYHLEKFIDLGKGFLSVDPTASRPTYKVESPVLGYDNIPLAGNSWRYGSRYKWLCNYLRVFANSGKDSEEYKFPAVMVGEFDKVYNDLTYRSDDHFLIFCIVNASYYAPMKPIEVSFDTYDEDKGANGSEGKA